MPELQKRMLSIIMRLRKAVLRAFAPTILGALLNQTPARMLSEMMIGTPRYFLNNSLRLST